MLDQTILDQLVQKYPNNRYMKRYISFIESCLQKQHEYLGSMNGTHVHHIVPKSWGGNERRINKVVVTYKEHMIAHHLLYKTGDYSMTYAFNIMLGVYKNVFAYNKTINLLAEVRSQFAKAQGKPVINLITEQVFPCARAVDHLNGLGNNTTQGAIRDRYKFLGGYWMYVEDMTESVEREREKMLKFIEDRHKNAIRKSAITNSRAVIDLTTGQRYINAKEASKVLGKHPNAVFSCMRDQCTCCGHIFAYVDELTTNDLEYEFNIRKRVIIKKKITHSGRSIVVNLTTGQVYSSIRHVYRVFHIPNKGELTNSIVEQTKWQDCYWQYVDQLTEQQKQTLDLDNVLNPWEDEFVQQLKVQQ